MYSVLLVNGSPHPRGCTFTALSEIAAVLEAEGVRSEIFNLGTGPFESCRACGWCKKNSGCVIDDKINQLAKLAERSNGFVFGSPVHYAGISGALKTALDRLYMSNSKLLAGKPAAGVVSCRRAGSTAALEQLNKYFQINCQSVVSSQYWPMVHGANAEQVAQDLEGLQTMRLLAKNLIWQLKSAAAAATSGVELPSLEEDREWTNFVR